MIVLFAVGGAVSALLPDTPRVDTAFNFAIAISFAVLILRWCEYDRWERGDAPWRFFTPLMVIAPGPWLMVPIYLISTRRLRGLVVATKAILFFAFLVVIAVATESAVCWLDPL